MVLIYLKLYIPDCKHAFPTIIKSNTVEILSTVDTNGEAILASISLKLKPTWATYNAEQSFAPSPQNPINSSFYFSIIFFKH